MQAGRNDPCPCGSGKKYKRCCMERDQAVGMAALRLDRVYGRLLSELEPFCHRFDDEKARAVLQFFGTDVPARLSEASHYAFVDWMTFSYRDWDGLTMVQRFAGSRSDLDDTERAMLAAWQGSRPGICRVMGSGQGLVRLQDCFTAQECLVRVPDPPLPERGTLLMGRVLPVGDGYRFGYDARSGSAQTEPAIRRMMTRELVRMRRQYPDAGWPDLFRERWPVLHEAIGHGLGLAGHLPEEPPGPSSLGITRAPVGAHPHHLEVEGRLQEYLSAGGASWDERRTAARLWWDAATALGLTLGSAANWAAGAAYAFHHYALYDDVTQKQVAEGMGVPVGRVSDRAGAIAGALGLRVLDERYADPFDTRVRGVRKLAWLEAACDAGDSGGS